MVFILVHCEYDNQFSGSPLFAVLQARNIAAHKASFCFIILFLLVKTVYLVVESCSFDDDAREIPKGRISPALLTSSATVFVRNKNRR